MKPASVRSSMSRVVGRPTLSALGMRHGDNPVDVFTIRGGILHSAHQGVDKTGSPRGCAHDYNIVSCANAAPSIPARSLRNTCRHHVATKAHPAGNFSSSRWYVMISSLKLGMCWQIKVEISQGQRVNHLLIAHIVARANLRDCKAEGQPPRKQCFALRNRLNSKPMPLQYGVGQLEKTLHYNPDFEFRF